jgi:hypothetical protein
VLCAYNLNLELEAHWKHAFPCYLLISSTTHLAQQNTSFFDYQIDF